MIDAGKRRRQDKNAPSRRLGEGFENLFAERSVFSIILILFVVFLVLGLLLAAWTMFFQSYIYNEPVGAIYWRAPAAAAALTVFLAIWIVCDYRSIGDPSEKEGHYQAGFNFSARETQTYKYLWLTYQDGKQHFFERSGDRYLDKAKQTPKSRPLQIVASDEMNGEKHVFKPPMDDKGHFKVDKDSQSLRYYEDGDPKKRYMDEAFPGQITIFHYGWLFGAIILHVGFLAVWFVGLWLLLRFQWSHALGLAIVIWAISLFILPMILTQAEKVRKENLVKARMTAALEQGVPQRSSAARFSKVRTAFQVGLEMRN